MDVGDWLRSLGLGQFEAAFRDNEIDGEVLGKHAGDNLKELGVASVGQRRKVALGHRESGRGPGAAERGAQPTAASSRTCCEAGPETPRRDRNPPSAAISR